MRGFMARIFDDITKTIGNTPLVSLKRIAQETKAEVLAELASFNPFASVKDRIGVAMLDAVVVVPDTEERYLSTWLFQE
jgi:cysteine synthase A